MTSETRSRPNGGSAPRLPSAAAADQALRSPARLKALQATGLLDSDPEEAFDRVTRLARELLDVPVSLVSLVDDQRQYFKSAAGLEEPWASRRETPLSHSICARVVASGGPVVVDDVENVPELEDNLAGPEMGVAAYAGVPLRSYSGEIYGAFCVIDKQPRSWSDDQLDIVQKLGTAVLQEIELRRLVGHSARHDRVTGLPDRGHFVELVDAALERPSGESTLVAILDVHPLDLVTDSFGEAVADRFLAEIAVRLRAFDGTAAVARVAEDQFAVACAVVDERAALSSIDDIRQCFEAPFAVGEHELTLTPNIGVALAEDGDDAAELLRGARAALRQARDNPGHLQVGGSARPRSEAIQQLQLENGLRLALNEGALHVVYQPQFRLNDLTLYGFEALMRWESPEMGSVSPTRFIPVAEATGLIVPLGEFVLAEACRQIVRWRAEAPELDLSVAVNVSPRQLEHCDLPALAKRALAAAGAPPSALRLEITESGLVTDSAAVIPQLEALASLGVCLELDDFGTVYSSLSQLSKLPLTMLKIDRSFVASLHDRRTGAIARAILALARALDLGVIAEGVETSTQLDTLRTLGCTAGQGYLLARPQPAEALLGLLEEHSRRACA